MSGTYAVVAVRGVADGKQRLRSFFRAGEIELVISRLTLLVAIATQRSGVVEQVGVISADTDLLEWLRRENPTLNLLWQPPHMPGLNAAFTLGARWALSQHAERYLALPADLPLIMPDAVCQLVKNTTPVVVVPDRHREGTNALLLSPPDAIPFAFGPASKARHLEAAKACGLKAAEANIPELVFDLDTPGDIHDLWHDHAEAAEILWTLAGLALDEEAHLS